MQVVLEEGCGASCGTGLRGKSGEYIFTTSFITIGFDPFDDVCFSSKLTSSTVCTVFPGVTVSWFGTMAMFLM
jgi:hypothetical protein